MVTLGLLALLAGAQDAGSVDTVEVEIAVTGEAQVPAQGYRVSAMFSASPVPGEDGKAKVAASKAQAVAAIAPLKPVEAAICAPAIARLGFVGNEAQGGPVEQEWMVNMPAFEMYAAVLPDRASAERAVQALREAGASNIDSGAVLFDCGAAERTARIDALARARVAVVPYAEGLKRRVGGIRKVSEGTAANWPASMLQAAKETKPGMVRVDVSTIVTFVLLR